MAFVWLSCRYSGSSVARTSSSSPEARSAVLSERSKSCLARQSSFETAFLDIRERPRAQLPACIPTLVYFCGHFECLVLKLCQVPSHRNATFGKKHETNERKETELIFTLRLYDRMNEGRMSTPTSSSEFFDDIWMLLSTSRGSAPVEWGKP